MMSGGTPAITDALPRRSRGTVVTVGSFDGVHLGHQAVLEEIARRAEAAGRESVLVTFEPHPLEVVNPQAAPPLLTTGVERREILAQTPLDLAYFLRFDRQVAALPLQRGPALAEFGRTIRYLVETPSITEMVPSKTLPRILSCLQI